MAKLIFTGKDFKERTYSLVLEKTTVGRSSRNTLVIHDSSVSVDHCEILVYGNEVIVRDHGSTNGTYVNGVRVTGQAQVKSGQTVRFGSVEALLELEPPPTTDLATDHTAVRAYSRAVRDQRRAQKNPPPEAVIEPQSLDPVQEDQTAIIARPPDPPSPPPQPTSAAVEPKKMRTVWIVVVAAAAIVLAWLAYALWKAGL